MASRQSIPKNLLGIGSFSIPIRTSFSFRELYTVFVSCVAYFSAVLEFMCDLIYTITMSWIQSSVQELVFETVLKQEIAFFDAKKPGNSCAYTTHIAESSESHLKERDNLLQLSSSVNLKPFSLCTFYVIFLKTNLNVLTYT